ncbi:MAG: SAM-dependent methyltransferase [Clostridia bacterium]|nr:SAM-dependent methyltransferase [Clostridia bacterium]
MHTDFSSQIPNLTPRLEKIASLVPQNRCTADIGTDHAYIPIYLVKTGIAKQAIASDIKRGPLLRAKENTEKYNLTERIDLRLGGGLSTLSPCDAEVIIIAGMGGILIADILEESRTVTDSAKLLILQPMTAVLELREYLISHGFSIESEHLESEDEKLYNIIVAKPNGECHYTKKELYLGKGLTETSPHLFPQYKAEVIKKLSRRAEGLKSSEKDENKQLLAETESILNLLKEE